MAINGFTRYVLGQLLVGMILVTAGLTCVIWLSQSLKFVEMIVNRGLSVGTFIFMTGLLLPNFLLIILPIALFTVIVFTYSKLINDRELVIMRARFLWSSCWNRNTNSRSSRLDLNRSPWDSSAKLRSDA